MGDWPGPGTPVKVAVKTWSGVVEHEGLALPPAGPKLITLKLANGYNVSYPESYVESVEILDEVEMSEEEGPCLLYTSPSPRDQRGSRMPSSA